METNFFSPNRRRRFRAELKAQGPSTDELLLHNPDQAVFGVNLTCAYPLPPPLAKEYARFTTELTELGSFLYAYPLWETHITIATFINFKQNQCRNGKRIADLAGLFRVLDFLEDSRKDWLPAGLPPLTLHNEPPVLSKSGIIIPFRDSSRSILRIREGLARAKAKNSAISDRLDRSGFGIPDIIHSTVARFVGSPPNIHAFVRDVDAAATALPSTAIQVDELVVTLETKPYMRDSEIIARYSI